uniref:Uncharacterized protein n=1 Tax=Acrobeloides nanus TaxID=290746 RepID=A0A914CFS7_9BILA
MTSGNVVDEFSFYSNEAEKELLEEEIHSQEEEPRIDQNSHGASDLSQSTASRNTASENLKEPRDNFYDMLLQEINGEFPKMVPPLEKYQKIFQQQARKIN